MKKLIIILIPLVLCRCASMEYSVGLGASIGAATGAAAAQMAHYNAKGTIVLGLGGALIGSAVAFLLQRSPFTTPISLPVTDIMKTNQPPLADAEKDVILVPDMIKGDHFVEKHKIWSIKKPARWQLPEGVPLEEENEEGDSNDNIE